MTVFGAVKSEIDNFITEAVGTLKAEKAAISTNNTPAEKKWAKFHELGMAPGMVSEETGYEKENKEFKSPLNDLFS